MSDEQGAIPEGMKAWAGDARYAPPSDWKAGQSVQFRCGERSKGATEYQWDHVGSKYDIIAYTPAADRLTDTGEEWTYTPDDREKTAILDLCDDQELSPRAVMRQALRQYQADHLRRKDGETVTWSGDEQRARDFAGVLATPKPPVDAGAMEDLRWIVEQCVRLVGDEAENWEIFASIGKRASAAIRNLSDDGETM
jgi:hypothetical protein